MDAIWRLLRGPFILPQHSERYHTCRWEKIDFDKAGCLVCGTVHKCDAITCKDVCTEDDSIICNVTGCVLSKVLVTNQWTDTCLTVCSKADVIVNDDVEKYIDELLTSNKTRECFLCERAKIAESLESKFVHHEPCAHEDDLDIIDIISNIVHKTCGRIPADFDLEKRRSMTSTCARFLNPVVANIQNNRSFRSFKHNTRQLVFGLLYLMRTGVYSHKKTILPRIANIEYFLPRECYLRSFYGVSPSIITDTENKLKFLIRNE